MSPEPPPSSELPSKHRQYFPPPSARVRLRRSIICMALSLLAGLGVVLAPSAVTCASVLAAGPLAFASVVLSAKAVRRGRERQLEAHEAFGRHLAVVALALAIILLLGQAWLSLAWLSAAREYSICAVSAANLRAVGQGIALYATDHGRYPGTFDDLVRAEILTPKQLISFRDPTWPCESIKPPYYSSFTYRPGPGPEQPDPILVLAFERTSSTRLNPGLLAGHGRLVLFGNGEVRTLDDKAFQNALDKDRERRAQLGWPVPSAP